MYTYFEKIVGTKYAIKPMSNGIISCPKGVFRIFNERSANFPFHTDGFNYGDLINNTCDVDKSLFPVMSDTDTNSTIAIILILNQTIGNKNEVDLFNCLVDELESFRDEIGMYSHWMGTKYRNEEAMKSILDNKPFYSPILNKGDLYVFSASRIHKLNNYINSLHHKDNRIVLATFACVKKNEIIIYQ